MRRAQSLDRWMYTVPGVIMQLGYTWEREPDSGADGEQEDMKGKQDDEQSRLSWADSTQGLSAVGGVSAGVPGEREGLWLRAVGRMAPTMRRVPVCESMIADHLVASIESSLDRLCDEQGAPGELRRLDGWTTGVRRPQLVEVLARKE